MFLDLFNDTSKWSDYIYNTKWKGGKWTMNLKDMEGHFHTLI
jgi:hypothetical protein